FKKTYDLDWEAVQKWAYERLKSDDIQPLQELSALEEKYLYWTSGQQQKLHEQIYETAYWVSAVNTDHARQYRSELAQAIEKAVFSDDEKCTEVWLQNGRVGVLFRKF